MELCLQYEICGRYIVFARGVQPYSVCQSQILSAPQHLELLKDSKITCHVHHIETMSEGPMTASLVQGQGQISYDYISRQSQIMSAP